MRSLTAFGLLFFMVFAFEGAGFVQDAGANNVGTNRQSCKKGFVWHYKMAKCIPKSELRGRNPRVFTE